jgi:hypothetical protein
MNPADDDVRALCGMVCPSDKGTLSVCMGQESFVTLRDFASRGKAVVHIAPQRYKTEASRT